MTRPDLTSADLDGLLRCNRECADLREWERAARKTRKAVSSDARLCAYLVAAVLGIGIGGGALLHIIGHCVA